MNHGDTENSSNVIKQKILFFQIQKIINAVIPS